MSYIAIEQNVLDAVAIATPAQQAAFVGWIAEGFLPDLLALCDAHDPSASRVVIAVHRRCSEPVAGAAVGAADVRALRAIRSRISRLAKDLVVDAAAAELVAGIVVLEAECVAMARPERSFDRLKSAVDGAIQAIREHESPPPPPGTITVVDGGEYAARMWSPAVVREVNGMRSAATVMTAGTEAERVGALVSRYNGGLGVLGANRPWRPPAA